jgi:hypothetical protein
MSIAALLILAAANATPAVALACPSLPGEALAYIGVFDGPPEQQADLAPDQHKSAGGTATNVWQIDAGPDGVYVKCAYGKALAGPYRRVETIKLPADAKTCRADYKTGQRPDDLTLQTFSCQ